MENIQQKEDKSRQKEKRKPEIYVCATYNAIVGFESKWKKKNHKKLQNGITIAVFECLIFKCI